MRLACAATRLACATVLLASLTLGLASLALVLASLAATPAHAQAGGRRDTIREKMRDAAENIARKRQDGYDVSVAESLLAVMRTAARDKDAGELRRLAPELRAALARSPRLSPGESLSPASAGWTALPVGPVAARWPSGPAGNGAFGVLDPYMNTSLGRAGATLRPLGVGWVRLGAPLSGGINWGSIERGAPANWGHVDSVLAQARRDGVRVLVTLAPNSPWEMVKCGGSREDFRRLPCDIAAYQGFVRRAVERYRGRVDAWQINNEPDHENFWTDTPENYARLVQATTEVIRELDPRTPILLAGITEEDFLQRTIRELVRLSPHRALADAGDLHYYGLSHTSGATGSLRKSYREVAAMERMFRRVGSGTPYALLPLWATETGTYDGSFGEMWPQQSEREQARDLVRRYAFGYASGMRAIFWASLVEWTQFKGRAINFNGMGLERNPANGRGDGRKLAYDTLRKLTGTLAGFSRAEVVATPEFVTAVRFSTPRGPVTVVWYDRWSATAPATLSVRLPFRGSTAKLVTAVPRGVARGAPAASHATRSIRPRGGSVTLVLDDDPLYILGDRE